MIFKALSSLVFLKRCLGCEGWLEQEERQLCKNCSGKLHFLKTEAFLPKLSKQYFERAYSILAYEAPLLDWIHQFKYSRELSWVFCFATLLSGFPLDWNGYDGIVAVPSDFWRRVRRGFNPSHLLADQLARQTQKPLLHLLRKSRSTKPQARLSGEQRLANVDKAFTGKPYCFGKSHPRLLLIDDIVTTGATANECAKALKKSGAAHVDLLTLARPL